MGRNITIESETASAIGDIAEAVIDEENAPPAKENLCLDRGYDSKSCREAATERGYTVHIPDPDKPVPAPTDPERHPPRRWVVEVSHSWFNRFRRLLIRWEKKIENYLGFVQIAASYLMSHFFSDRL